MGTIIVQNKQRRVGSRIAYMYKLVTDIFQPNCSFFQPNIRNIQTGFSSYYLIIYLRRWTKARRVIRVVNVLVVTVATFSCHFQF